MRIIFIILLSVILSGCIGETITTFGPLKVKPGDLATAPIKKAIINNKKNEEK